jgi:hypothetical protein
MYNVLEVSTPLISLAILRKLGLASPPTNGRDTGVMALPRGGSEFSNRMFWETPSNSQFNLIDIANKITDIPPGSAPRLLFPTGIKR